MPKEEFRHFSNLLQAPEFRNLSGNGGGLNRQKAETFAAEIAAAQNIKRLVRFLSQATTPTLEAAS
jgi:hypothetical protein